MKIYVTDIENITSVCFDTGLDPRSFARTKMSQSLIENGFFVHPDGSHEVWRAAGVNELNGHMRVWGPLPLPLPQSNVKRLDQIIAEENAQQAALQAVVLWIRAKMFLGETRSALNPGAAFICSETGSGGYLGSVFFSPEHLSTRCLYIEGLEIDRYNCPDLLGMDAAAFCAGVMLYQILTGSHPYPSVNIFQDMREGVFLPVNLAAPELNRELSDLIQDALLLSLEKKKPQKNGANILSEMLELLMSSDGKITSISALLTPVPESKKEQLEKEKKIYLSRQNTLTKIRRFTVRNKIALIGAGAGLLFAFVIFFSTYRSISQRWTTAGLYSDQVVMIYYDSFSSLDHMRMEACIQGASRVDVDAAVQLYAVTKARQAYEGTIHSTLIPAQSAKTLGMELPAPNIFGVTDLTLSGIAGSENDLLIIYRADYQLWAPDESSAFKRSDILTLKRDKRKNWRIIEILRTES